MKKTTKIIASAITVVLLASVAIGGYITYLSNESDANTTVEGPAVTLETKTGDTWATHDESPLDLGSIYGTGSVNFDFKVTKNAEDNDWYEDKDIYNNGWSGAQIDGTFTGTITDSNGGMQLDELDGITINLKEPIPSDATWSIPTTLKWTNDGDDGNDNFTPTTSSGEGITVEYPTVITWDQTGYWGTINIVFSQHAQGDYSINMQVI